MAHVAPSDGILDRRRAEVIFSWAGVRALGDVVIADPTSGALVATDAHVPSHAVVRAVQLKEAVYAKRYPGDLFYPFAFEVLGALHSIFDHLLCTYIVHCIKRRQYPPASVIIVFFRQRVSIALKQAQAFIILCRVRLLV